MPVPASPNQPEERRHPMRCQEFFSAGRTGSPISTLSTNETWVVRHATANDCRFISYPAVILSRGPDFLCRTTVNNAGTRKSSDSDSSTVDGSLYLTALYPPRAGLSRRRIRQVGPKRKEGRGKQRITIVGRGTCAVSESRAVPHPPPSPPPPAPLHTAAASLSKRRRKETTETRNGTGATGRVRAGGESGRGGMSHPRHLTSSTSHPHPS